MNDEKADEVEAAIRRIDNRVGLVKDLSSCNTRRQDPSTFSPAIQIRLKKYHISLLGVSTHYRIRGYDSRVKEGLPDPINEI